MTPYSNKHYKIKAPFSLQYLPGAGAFAPQLVVGFVAGFVPSVSLATGNLWQDAAKTIAATANNDPVRVVRDPWSGIEWTAPSDAARGLLKISGGKSWIETDGVDDSYVTSSVERTRSQSLFGSVRYLSQTNFGITMSVFSGGPDEIRLNGGYTSISYVSLDIDTLDDSGFNVIGSDITFQSIRTTVGSSLKINERSPVSATGNLGNPVTPAQLCVGARPGSSIPGNLRLHGILYYITNVSDTTASALRLYLQGLYS
jgi:hypothetical protein